MRGPQARSAQSLKQRASEESREDMRNTWTHVLIAGLVGLSVAAFGAEHPALQLFPPPPRTGTSLSAEHSPIAFFAPCTIIAIPTYCNVCYRWRGDTGCIVRPGARVVMRCGEPHDERMAAALTAAAALATRHDAEPPAPLASGAAGRVPGTEAAGLADAMIEARKGIAMQDERS